MSTVATLRRTLAVVEDFRTALLGWDERHPEAWLDETEAGLHDALADLDIAVPLEVTPGQVLMARFDALGLTYDPPPLPSSKRDGDLQREFDRTSQLADEFRGWWGISDKESRRRQAETRRCLAAWLEASE